MESQKAADLSVMLPMTLNDLLKIILANKSLLKLSTSKRAAVTVCPTSAHALVTHDVNQLRYSSYQHHTRKLS